MEINFSNSMEQISSLLKSYIPLIWVNTYEEDRFIKNLHNEVIHTQNKELWEWSSYRGLIRYEQKDNMLRASGDMDKTWTPNIALEAIIKHKRNESKKGSVFILKDFHTVLTQPIPRMLRDMYSIFIKDQKTIIVVAPFLAYGGAGLKYGIEPTLDKQITVINYELPQKEYIEKRIKSSVSHMKEFNKKNTKTKLDYTDDEYNKFATAVQGLTEIEMDNAIIGSLSHLQKIDEKRLLLEKKQIIQRSDILEYIDCSFSINEVGGLDLAKKYFNSYNDQFSKEAKAFGVEPLRGVLLTGICGTGKTLISKSVANMWSLPLLRLDIGRAMSGIVGSSELNIRQALHQISSIAPCVCQIDEIEKALSGTSSSAKTDGGTMARVFGTLLTAMEEGMKNVIFIATSNDIQALPPELIRRFNEVFYVDLPYPEEREEIFNIHLKKRSRDAKKLNLDMNKLVEATHLFTGSEIEKVVKESIAIAFRQKEKDVNTDIILTACNETKPIAKVMKEKIDTIRDWARSRARYASSIAESENSRTVVRKDKPKESNFAQFDSLLEE